MNKSKLHKKNLVRIGDEGDDLENLEKKIFEVGMTKEALKKAKVSWPSLNIWRLHLLKHPL